MTAQNDIHDDWNKTYSFEYSIKYLWPTKYIYRSTWEKNRNYTRFDVFNTPTEILPECHSSSFVDNKYFRPFKPQVTLHNLDVESDIMFIRTTSLCLLNFFCYNAICFSIFTPRFAPTNIMTNDVFTLVTLFILFLLTYL